MKFASKGLLFLTALSLNFSALQLFAQDNTLQSQFEELKTKSNNYQVYKVVKKTDLESFWNSVADTLRNNASNTNALKSEVAQLKSEVSTLQNQVAQRDSSLANQEYMIEHMDFAGVSVTKGTYQTITWIIILGLLVVVIVLYLRFTGAHKVTKSTKLEFANLQEEFESHRQKARETETKLKRDLQTEINKVEEMKEKFGS
jgi:preprotein translocase subunit SecF